METLAKQIEERMHGDWSMIREDDLERIWPINEEDAVIRVYDAAGNVIETHEHAGEFKEF